MNLASEGGSRSIDLAVPSNTTPGNGRYAPTDADLDTEPQRTADAPTKRVFRAGVTRAAHEPELHRFSPTLQTEITNTASTVKPGDSAERWDEPRWLDDRLRATTDIAGRHVQLKSRRAGAESLDSPWHCPDGQGDVDEEDLPPTDVHIRRAGANRDHEHGAAADLPLPLGDELPTWGAVVGAALALSRRQVWSAWQTVARSVRPVVTLLGHTLAKHWRRLREQTEHTPNGPGRGHLWIRALRLTVSDAIDRIRDGKPELPSATANRAGRRQHKGRARRSRSRQRGRRRTTADVSYQEVLPITRRSEDAVRSTVGEGGAISPDSL